MLKNANEKHNVNYLTNIVNHFRKGGNFFRMVGNFFRKAILTKVTFGRRGDVPLFSRRSLGRRSVS